MQGADREREGRQSTWDMAGQQAVSTWAFAHEQQGVRHSVTLSGGHWHVAERQRQERGAWRSGDNWEGLGWCNGGAKEARQGEKKRGGGKGGKFIR